MHIKDSGGLHCESPPVLREQVAQRQSPGRFHEGSMGCCEHGQNDESYRIDTHFVRSASPGCGRVAQDSAGKARVRPGMVRSSRAYRLESTLPMAAASRGHNTNGRSVDGSREARGSEEQAALSGAASQRASCDESAQQAACLPARCTPALRWPLDAAAAHSPLACCGRRELASINAAEAGERRRLPRLAGTSTAAARDGRLCCGQHTLLRGARDS